MISYYYICMYIFRSITPSRGSPSSFCNSYAYQHTHVEQGYTDAPIFYIVISISI